MDRSRLIALLAGVAFAMSGAALPARGGSPSFHTPVRNVSNTAQLAEGEETVAINPTDPRNIIVGSNQWQALDQRNSTNFSLGASGTTMCARWASQDGGRTWSGGAVEESGLGTTANPLPDPTGTVPSEFVDPGNLISGDQNTVFDREGNAYYDCIDFGVGTGDAVIPVYRSSDGGRHWSKPVIAFSERDTGIQVDRPWLAIDNTGGPRDGTLYLTWETMFYQPYNPAVYGRTSTDGGRTWGPVVRVDDAAHEAMWDPRQFPVVGADGTLYVMYDASPFHTPSWDECCSGRDPSIALAISRDGGATFTRTIVQDVTHPPAPPDEAEPYFTEFIPAIAADTRRAGRVAVAWPEVVKGESRILLRTSRDGGETWTKPIDVNDDPRGKGNQHDHVTMTYLPDGRLAVVWRDRRANGGQWSAPWQILARTVAAGRRGSLRLGSVVEVTGAAQLPTTGHRGSMPSEYIGVTATKGGLWVSWDQMNGTYPDNMLRFVPVSAL
ncbi:MAG: sialidase family protein [Actinomycetota bacterium]